MARRVRAAFETVRTEGALLPADLLARIAEGTSEVPGLAPADYDLAPGERINEAVNRAWNRLLGSFKSFSHGLSRDAVTDEITAKSGRRWVVTLLEELGYGRLVAGAHHKVPDKDYGVTNMVGCVPVHLVATGADLDSRTAKQPGTARSSPHGVLQEFLNRSDAHLWGLVTNALELRILRDNVSLVRQAHVSFDLLAMFAGEVYSDFSLLWILAHRTRLDSTTRPEEAWIERWSKQGMQEGARLREALRLGVTNALTALGTGFVAHPANGRLREKLTTGQLPPRDLYRQLLRLVYRLLVVFVAEDRGLLFPATSGADERQDVFEARRRFREHYGTARLRHRAQHRRADRHHDLYRGFAVVLAALGSRDGCPRLGLAPLGSFLFSGEACPELDGAELSNTGLLDAVRSLAFTVEGKTRLPVDYRNLNVEEMGSVYESLLELHPVLDMAGRTFTLAQAGGHERKTSGSYYTPDSLVQCLLESALDPVLDAACAKPDPESALLALKVCDPACGSGHFLIAAGRRIARRLAAHRTGDPEPSPEALRHALRDVVGRCLFGVDINPMAVELCKVSLWMEALEPGRPLSFLDSHIIVGNSLLGTTPSLLSKGVPDAAFEAIEGDDKKVARELKKRNKQEREQGIQRLTGLGEAALPPLDDEVRRAVEELERLTDDAVADVDAKAEALKKLRASPAYRRALLRADAWCAAFTLRKSGEGHHALTHDGVERLGRAPETVPTGLREAVEREAADHGFTHWHLAFPTVFRTSGEEVQAETGWAGGFDVVLGNPPWERVKLQEQEFFASRHAAVAAAPKAAERKRMIRELVNSHPELHAEFLDARRDAEAESQFLRGSGRYPLCGRGDINTYAVFAETNFSILSSGGQAGCVVPSGIATDDTTKNFFSHLVSTGSVGSLYDFENAAGLFPGVGHGRARFTLLTMRQLRDATGAPPARFAFLAHTVDDLKAEGKIFNLTRDDFKLLNPNTLTTPVFASSRDAEITKAIYRRLPVLVRECEPESNPWCVEFGTLFHMAISSEEFRTQDQLEAEGYELIGNEYRNGRPVSGKSARYLPLYEAKMIHHYDHRFGDYRDHPPGSQNTHLPDVPEERLQNPDYVVLPKFWVAADAVERRLKGWKANWLFGWRDVTHATNERTLVCSCLPRVGAGHKILMMYINCPMASPAALVGNLSSFVLDYCTRQKVGGISLTNFTVKQLPVVPPEMSIGDSPWSSGTAQEFIVPRVVELVCTGLELSEFAKQHGFGERTFRVDLERRRLLRAELDAAFFHLYGITRDDVDYILDTFPIVRRNDEKQFGEYRTKRLILEVYDAMADAIRTGMPYQTRLDPPPAHPSLSHPTSGTRRP